MGPMGGPMDFGRNKSKFQEVPETGITFDDVAVSPHCLHSSRRAGLPMFSCTSPCLGLPACLLILPEECRLSQEAVCPDEVQTVLTAGCVTAGSGWRQAGAAGGGRLPEEPGQVHRPGCQDPQGLSPVSIEPFSASLNSLIAVSSLSLSLMLNS